MRIISKFKDYYDSVQSFGQDSLCVYHRKSEEIEITNKKLIETIEYYFDSMPVSHNGSISGAKYIIGFCGKLYPVWGVTCYPHKHDSLKLEKTFAYNSDDIEHFYTKYKTMSDVLSRFNEKLSISTGRYSWKSRNFKRNNIDLSVELFGKNNKLEHLFFDHKAPVFVIPTYDFVMADKVADRHKMWKVIINPCLRDYDFYKQKDVYTAYQDINQYISGILGLNDPDIVHISDKDMKDQKGFYEYSFKKLPTKKR